MPKSELENELPDDQDEGAEEQPKTPRQDARNGRPAPPAKPKAKPEPVAEVEEEEEEEEEGEEEAYRHPPSLVRIARHFGISKAEIDATPTEQLMLAVQVEREERKAARDAQRPAEKPAAKKDDDEIEFEHEIELRDPVTGEVTGKRKAKLTDYDPAVQAVIKENREIKKRLEEREKADQGREQNRIFAAVDDAFADMDDPELFGAGTAAELHAADKTAELARRNAIWNAAGVKPGDSDRTVARKITKAREVLFGKKKAKKAAAEEEPEETGYAARPSGKPKKRTRAERWEASHVSRPTGRRGAQVKGREAALTEIENMLIEEGLDPGPRRNHALEDELPGDDD